MHVRRSLWVSVLGLALAPAALAFAAAQPDEAGQPTFDEALYHDRATAERLARERLGRGFACAVVSGPLPGQAGPRRAPILYLYVVGGSPVERAERIRRQLKQPDRARVRRTSPRMRAATLERIRRQIEREMPTGSTSASVAFESPLGRSICPRVEITIEPRPTASAAKERWARRARKRYGADRVVIRRATITPRR